jgi:hypothetical protein
MKSEVIEKITVLLIGAFGFVAALAWNDTVKAIFTAVYGTASTITGMIIYAVIVTIVAVIVTLKLGQLAEKAKK